MNRIVGHARPFERQERAGSNTEVDIGVVQAQPSEDCSVTLEWRDYYAVSSHAAFNQHVEGRILPHGLACKRCV